MPGARGKGERRIEAALADLARALDASGAPWMIIGGIAVISRGVRRMTTDVDAVVQGDAVDVDGLLKRFARWRIAPRIEKIADFARANLILLLRHEPSGVDLDVSLGWTSFEVEALAARDRTAYGRVVAPMARPEDLVIFKAFAARPRDIEDATALLVLHRDVDLARIRRRLRELASLADAPALIEGLEALIAQAMKIGGGRTRAGSRTTAKPRTRPRSGSRPGR